jgi:hypothetical protein
LGSWFLNICLAQGVLVVVLVAGVAVSLPSAPGRGWFAAALGAALVVPVLAFPVSRTTWLAIDLLMRPLELDEGVPPGFELER